MKMLNSLEKDFGFYEPISANLTKKASKRGIISRTFFQKFNRTQYIKADFESFTNLQKRKKRDLKRL
jgi:hypothetical protein